MEVIRFGAPNERPPLLFVHGSFCAAWVWTRYFLPAFAQAGWHGAAISLRGHGNNEGAENINAFGITDFLEDIEDGARLFDTEPILVGHSLGGYLVQKYALERSVRGQILLAAPSLMGLQNSSRHIATRNPMLALQLGILMAFGPARANTGLITAALFTDRKEAEKMAGTMPALQRESSRVFLEANWPDFRSPTSRIPTLALGGDEDDFVPEFDLRYEAQFWNGHSKVLHGVPHGVMVDPSWPLVAKEMLGWLSANFSAA
jgi:pimeloyl-ACP methyl ester carboxylesterase